MSAPTIRQELREAAQALKAAGVADPMRDARLLMAHALGIPVARLSLYDDASLTGTQAAQFAAHLSQRQHRQPVAQIIGRRAFWRHDFTVTRDTLDPRPETETLVAEALRLPWRSVLDLGTGSGAILLSLLAERPGVTGLGTDRSPAALAVARDNAARLGIAADFTIADWFTGITGRFDLIVSNPPYLAAAEMAEVAPELRDWEPADALTDHGDGLSAYRAIAAGARAHLNGEGHVLCEIGYRQGAEICAIFAASGAHTRLIPDLDGRDRVILAHF